MDCEHVTGFEPVRAAAIQSNDLVLAHDGVTADRNDARVDVGRGCVGHEIDVFTSTDSGKSLSPCSASRVESVRTSFAGSPVVAIGPEPTYMPE